MTHAATASSVPTAASGMPASQTPRLANAIRALAMDAVEAAKSGHPGMPMGMADVAAVLYSRFLKFDPSAPRWPDRDRFVLSAGHGSMLLYALLYLTGYEQPLLDDIKRFRKLGSPCAGHPEYGHLPGVETTTGPLGQGIANAVGMALAERALNARFGDELADHRTYVIAGDGDLMEGIAQEACSLAGHLKLSRLIVLFDDNHISIDGDTALSDSTDTLKRFAAMGWATLTCDGHDIAAVTAALDSAQGSDRPVLIACRTIIGYGMPTRAGTNKAHSDAPGAEEIAGARANLDWPHEPFAIPGDVLAGWRAMGARGAALHAAWQARKNAAEPSLRARFDAALAGEIPASVDAALTAHKKMLSETRPSLASRKAAQGALEVINREMEFTLGGSADLTGSNLTRTEALRAIAAGDFAGRYIHYGIREHGMAAAMNGIALHGGFVPYGGTFLVFSDYARPSLRLAALMGIRVIHVMTHDSIGVGEDGPTHQPVEHLAALRAIPNLLVLRPADAVEATECWQIALGHKKGPSVLALSRQNLPALRTRHVEENLSARGGYEISPAAGRAQVTLLATGSETGIAVEAQGLLAAKDILARVVSLPSFELFEAQDAAYRETTLGPGTVRVAVEAAVRQGWDRYLGERGRFVGMQSFGASAPYTDLYRHFGITPEAVAAAAEAALHGA